MEKVVNRNATFPKPEKEGQGGEAEGVGSQIEAIRNLEKFV